MCQKRHVRMDIDVALMFSSSGGCMKLQHWRSYRSRSHTTKKSSEQEVPPTHTAPSRPSGVPARKCMALLLTGDATTELSPQFPRCTICLPFSLQRGGRVAAAHSGHVMSDRCGHVLCRRGHNWPKRHRTMPPTAQPRPLVRLQACRQAPATRHATAWVRLIFSSLAAAVVPNLPSASGPLPPRLFPRDRVAASKPAGKWWSR
jgi:hypothetical protein